MLTLCKQHTHTLYMLQNDIAPTRRTYRLQTTAQVGLHETGDIAPHKVHLQEGCDTRERLCRSVVEEK